MPHDTTIPEGPPTTPMLPEDLPPIEAGRAAEAIAEAFSHLSSAVARAEAVCAAVGRALDTRGAQ